jgi:hypothetical protein
VILPVLADVRAPHIVDLFHKMRFTSERKLAQRSIYNIYSVVSALFRDAALEGLIDASPCILTDAQLGPLVDADPESPKERLGERARGRPQAELWFDTPSSPTRSPTALTQGRGCTGPRPSVHSLTSPLSSGTRPARQFRSGHLTTSVRERAKPHLYVLAATAWRT